MKRSAILLAATAAATLFSGSAMASIAEIQARGGWANALEEFPYATEDDSFAPGPEFRTDYGSGAYGELDVYLGDLSGVGFGIELGGDYTQLKKDTNTGGTLDSNCDDGTYPVLGLFDLTCHDAVFLEADTRIVTADFLLKKRFVPGIYLGLGGLALFVDSDLYAEHLFAGGFENFVNRDTSIDAYGVKAGVEYAVPLFGTGLSLSTEAYGGWVWGDRTVDILDTETFDGIFNDEAFLSFKDGIDIPMVDAAAALSWKLSPLMSLEVGGKYRRLFGAMFTEDTITPDSGIGKDEADLDYWTVFGGVTFTL